MILIHPLSFAWIPVRFLPRGSLLQFRAWIPAQISQCGSLLQFRAWISRANIAARIPVLFCLDPPCKNIGWNLCNKKNRLTVTVSLTPAART